MEPDWDELRGRMTALTMRQLQPIKRAWFMGLLGGASSKAETVSIMVSQARYWWHEGLNERVEHVLEDLEAAEREVCGS